MKTNIITISRQFGSGGRTIAKETAKELGWAYYDKEIIEQVAQSTGYAPEYVEEMGEYSPGGNIFSYGFLGRTPKGISPADHLWSIQRRLILELADREPCVILGRCADYILREREDVCNVFIHASKELRAKRIVEKYGESPEAPEKRLRDKDKKRAANYRYYTDREWGASEHYHLTLDSGFLGTSLCTQLILAAVRSQSRGL